ncbi:MAG TPA: HEAT repeat domain-containing protein [Terriglobales bacterium]|nr:HEAT repeat domain-containing protein [Terriglobales bacterium]
MDAPNSDPRLKPTPDYGTLTPASEYEQKIIPAGSFRSLRLVAVLLGAFGASVALATGNVHATWDEIAQLLSIKGKPKPASPALLSTHEIEGLDRAPAQSQAELLLERAINHYNGASDQIAARVDGWHGQLEMTPSLHSLFSTALNSNDLRVRAAAIEVDLAALNVPKTSGSVDQYAADAESSDQKTAVWGLWTLGLLGNRGVEPQRAAQVLTAHVHDSNENIRYWAVEGLAYLGTDEVIPILLQTFHDDPSPTIRERAACGLAQSGMLSEEQRRTAVPELLNFAEDNSLDAQTHGWVYQALRDITGQSLPSDPSSWRNWYSSHGA